VHLLLIKGLTMQMNRQRDDLILNSDTASMPAKLHRESTAKKWQKTQFSNLVRYVPSGKYFARSRVRGKLIRKA
jgi:hypothetical protein